MIQGRTRLRIAGWTERGIWLRDLDSGRRLLRDPSGQIAKTSEPVPDAQPEPEPELPDDLRELHGWGARAGDRWALLDSPTLFVGRASQRHVVVHLSNDTIVRLGGYGSKDFIHAYPAGVVLHFVDGELALPWEAFELAEIRATPYEVVLAPSVARQVRILRVGASSVRVELVKPEPRWRRTATVASHGNPLGLAPGDVVFAHGNEIHARDFDESGGSYDSRFAIEHLTRSDQSPSGLSVQIGEPIVVAVGNVKCPSWTHVLVDAGLIDAVTDVPEHLWTRRPVEALMAIYEPREAMARGFLHYELAFRQNTKSPAADFARLAGAPKLDVKGIRVDSDGGDGFGAAIAAVNARLEAAGIPRRVYECRFDDYGYAFIARTPAEMTVLEAAGLAVLGH